MLCNLALLTASCDPHIYHIFTSDPALPRTVSIFPFFGLAVAVLAVGFAAGSLPLPPLLHEGQVRCSYLSFQGL